MSKKFLKTFCCYNCLDLYHAQSFFSSTYLLLVFPVLSSRKSVLKRLQILSLCKHPLINFSSHVSKNLKKTFCCYNCLDLYHAQSFFPVHICYLFSWFSRAGKVSWKGYKFSAFGLELAKPFLNTFAFFLLSRTAKTGNSY